MLLVWCHLLTNKLIEASIQSNNDLIEAFILNDLEFLLLSMIFS